MLGMKLDAEEFFFHFDYFSHLYLDGKFWSKSQIYDEIRIALSCIAKMDGLPEGMAQDIKKLLKLDIEPMEREWLKSAEKAFLCTTDLLEFFKHYRVPEVWHEYITKVNHDMFHDTIQQSWLLQQEDCDAATAIFLLWCYPELNELIADTYANGGYQRYKCFIYDTDLNVARNAADRVEDPKVKELLFELIHKQPEKDRLDTPVYVDEGYFSIMGFDMSCYGPEHQELKLFGIQPDQRTKSAAREALQPKRLH